MSVELERRDPGAGRLAVCDHACESPRRAAGGFTLVELVIVLVLVGIGAGFGIHSYRVYRETHRTRAAATELLSVINVVRGRAAATNQVAVLDFAPGGLATSEGFVRVYLDLDRDGAVDAGEEAEAALPTATARSGMSGFQVRQGVYVRGPSGASTGPLGVAVQADGVTFTNDAISIFPDGTSAEAGHVTLEDAAGRAYAVTLTAGGGARLFRWDGSSWR